MRYPLWAFLVLVLVPPFTLHASMTGKTAFRETPSVQVATLELSPESGPINIYRF